MSDHGRVEVFELNEQATAEMRRGADALSDEQKKQIREWCKVRMDSLYASCGIVECKSESTESK